MTFNGVTASISYWNATSILATVPSNAATGPVVVTVGGVSSNSDHTFTVTAPHAPTVYYYVEDMLGSSRAIVQTGQTSPCYDGDFLPFGYEKIVVNTCSQPYKFEGKERDTETNNDDFGARYYSNHWGRWLSPDWSSVPAPVPYANLTNPQTLNLYAMVSDNPESFADLDGHGSENVPNTDTAASTTTAFWNDTNGIPDWYMQMVASGQAQQAQNPVQMQLSNAGADFIGGYENPKKKGYNAKSGLWFQYDDGYGTQTIGYGHAVKGGEDFSKGLTTDQIRSLFKADSSEAVAAVNSMTTRAGITQNQFDALVSLQFNAGPHAYTPPLRDFNATGTAKKSDFTGHYITSGGVPSRGLAIRRAAEWRIFNEGVYDASH